MPWVQNAHDIEAAIAAARAGIEGAAAHSEPDWTRAAEIALLRVAETHREFTTDDVWLLLSDADGNEWQPHEPSAMGPVVIRARRAGVMTPAGRHALSRRVSAHRKPLPVWRSLRYRGE